MQFRAEFNPLGTDVRSVMFTIAKKRKIVSFEFDRWEYTTVSDAPTFKTRRKAEKVANSMNRDENRVDGSRWEWYYSAIEKVEWK